MSGEVFFKFLFQGTISNQRSQSSRLSNQQSSTANPEVLQCIKEKQTNKPYTHTYYKLSHYFEFFLFECLHSCVCKIHWAREWIGTICVSAALLALPAKQDSYLLLPQSPFGRKSVTRSWVYWVVGRELYRKRDGGESTFWEWYIYIFSFLWACVLTFSPLRSFTSEVTRVSCPLLLSSHLSEEYASLYVSECVCGCVCVCVCVHLCIYMYCCMRVSACVCFMAGHWIVKGNQGDNCCKCLRFVVFIFTHTVHISIYLHL